MENIWKNHCRQALLTGKTRTHKTQGKKAYPVPLLFKPVDSLPPELNNPTGINDLAANLGSVFWGIVALTNHFLISIFHFNCI